MNRAAILAVVVGCSSSQRPPPPPPVPVDTVALQPTPIVDATEYLAMLRSRTAATLQPHVEGQITAIDVKPGDRVTTGQVLMEIDPGRQPAAVTQARETRASREAQLALATKNLERVKELVGNGALPRQELDNAQAAADAARADVGALDAQIAGSVADLRFYKITAPEAGVVGDIPVRVGDRVSQQSLLTTVTDNTMLEANVSIPVDRVHELALGTRIDLADEAGSSIGTGAVSFISAQVNPETQSVLVKATIDNAAGKLRVNQLVRARVVWRQRLGLEVPALAVTRLGGQAFVYVADGRVAKQRPVQLGDLVDNRYPITEGLKPGEAVVVSQLQKLRDGAAIAPKAHP